AREDQENADDDRDILAMIEAAAREGTSITTAEVGPRPVQKVIASRPDCPDRLKSREGKERIIASLARLKRAGKIERNKYRKTNRHGSERWWPAQFSADEW